MAEEKTVRRIPPCSSCDPEGLSSWLTDMAREGLHLRTDGIGSHTWRFFQGEPKEIPYRLIPGRGKPTLGAWVGRAMGDLDQATRDRYAAQGWEYVTRYWHFHIYRGAESYEGFLRTEPRVGPEEVARAAQWEWRGVPFWFFMAVVAAPVFMYAVHGWQNPLFFFNEYLWFLAILLVLAVGMVFYRAAHWLPLKQLQRKLENGGRMDHKKDWKRAAFVHRVGSVSFAVLMVAWSLLSGFLFDRGGYYELLQDYPGDPPFPTLVELVPEGALENHDGMVSYHSSILFPEQIVWRENGVVDWLDGRGPRETDLHLEYYEARTPALAQELVRELQQEEETNYGNSKDTASYPDLGVDFACMYQEQETLLMQEGSVVIRVWVTQDGQCIPMDTWAAPIAESMQSE